MHEEIGAIRRKLATTPWPKFINSVQISGLHGWSGQEVRFPFPVCVITGENGTGKSTVLKAAASLYTNPERPARAFYPSTFFPDTAWEKTTNAELRFTLTEGQRQREYLIRKYTLRWRFQANRPKRDVVWLDVSRTLPLDATVGYAYIAKRTATEVSADNLSDELTRYYSSIMGRKYDRARNAVSNVDRLRKVGVVVSSNNEFSQFHQGAGEDATFDLLILLQNVPDHSLVIIDEVEASLHPRAQRRLIHFLLWLARTRQLQVILSSHSPFVIEELPIESRIFLARTRDGIEVINGISADYALTRMDDIDKPDLYLLSEDSESSILTLNLLREAAFPIQRVRLMEVGPADVVRTFGRLAVGGRLFVPAIGILDADCGESPGCLRLPGHLAPEPEVLQGIVSGKIEFLSSMLKVNAGGLSDSFERAMTLPDHHDWLSQIANELRLSVTYLWESCCRVWAQHCVAPDETAAFAKRIDDSMQDNYR